MSVPSRPDDRADRTAPWYRSRSASRPSVVRAEHQRNQQAPHPAVAVAKRVDSFELVVRHREPHQERQRIRLQVEVTLPAIERFQHLRHGRRHEARLSDGRVPGADVVLHCPERTGPVLAAAHAGEENLVDITHEAERHRDRFQEIEPVLHRPHVVEDFLCVSGGAGALRGRRHAGFQQHELLGRGESAFNAAREDRFPPQQRLADQIWVDQAAGRAREAAEGVVGLREEADRWPRRVGAQQA